jgi:hypothetical protein
MFVLGVALGCSQQDGTTATSVPIATAPVVATTTAANDRVLSTPTVPDIQEQPVAPARDRLISQARSGFVPLDDPIFLAADETEYFGDDELVLGVEFAGEVRAYPVRMLRYHHVVNDTVGGEPLLVTY